jgi:hypothetical protein
MQEKTYTVEQIAGRWGQINVAVASGKIILHKLTRTLDRAAE